jgi:hypothetical protein
MQAAQFTPIKVLANTKGKQAVKFPTKLNQDHDSTQG